MKLTLKSTVNNWELFNQRKQNPKFKKARAQLIQRDRFSCQFCGHISQYLEIINADNNYRHNTTTNLVSACELCAKATLIDSYGLDYRGQDRIIYLPELHQEQISQLCRVLFCTMLDSGEANYNAKKTFAQLQDRAAWLDEKAGCQLSQPGMFNIYLRQPDKDLQLLQHFRFLPSFDSYQELVPRWKDELQGLLEASEALGQ